MGTKAIARRSLFSNVECHISGAACRGYFITMWQRMLTRSGGPIIGRLVVHILSPAHLPLASDISVGSRTSRSSTRDKECSISHQSDILLLTDLLFRQLLVLSPKHSSSVGLVGSTLLTIDKGSEGPEIAALSHIALLQGPLQGEGKGSENVDSSPPHPYPQLAPQGRQVASHVVMVVLNTMVQSLLHHAQHCLHHSEVPTTTTITTNPLAKGNWQGFPTSLVTEP